MPRRSAPFTKTALQMMVDVAKQKGAPSVEFEKDGLIYRVNLREPAAAPKKPVAYDWESADKEREIIL